MDESERHIHVLASPCNQGKTTTALLLEKYFKSRGLKVACLQTMKGQYDVGTFLQNNCYHYTIPTEAAKSKEVLEQWIPEGIEVIDLPSNYQNSSTSLVINLNAECHLIKYLVPVTLYGSAFANCEIN